MTPDASLPSPDQPVDMAAKLSELRGRVPGCHLAGYIDLSARMLMAHDARSKAPQERLDGLADRAVTLLDAPGGTSHVIAISQDNLEIFFNAPGSSEDALVLICGLGTDPDLAIHAASAWLNEGATDV